MCDKKIWCTRFYDFDTWNALFTEYKITHRQDLRKKKLIKIPFICIFCILNRLYLSVWKYESSKLTWNIENKHIKMSSVTVILLVSLVLANAINHWGITPDGTIQPQVWYINKLNDYKFWWNRRTITKIYHEKYLVFVWICEKVDSIFYLRRPDDLLAFLNQFDYRQTINSINAQLLSLQMEITDKVQQSTFFQVSSPEFFCRLSLCFAYYFGISFRCRWK